MSFVGSSTKNATDGSIIKVHGSTIPGSVNPTVAEKVAEHVFSLPMSSRSDFVITRKKLIHNRIEESKKPSLKPSLKSGLGYVKIESRSKTPPPRRNIFSQPRYNTPQSRRNSREPIHQNFYLINCNNNQSQGFAYGKLYSISTSQSIATNARDVCLRTCLEPDKWIKDSGCSKHMNGNKSLFSTYKAYDGVEESLNVTFDESPPSTKLSPLVDDDVGEEEAIRNNIKVVNNNNEEDESIEVD
ncbi:hypothetical protein Tco_0278216 [Tanacetum coccineum]